MSVPSRRAVSMASLVLSTAFLVTCPVLAEPAATTPGQQATAASDSRLKTQFVRLVRDDNGRAMLETAETAYRNADGVTVTLIGAVHIADAAYFAGLDASFDAYDALLYEMVKPATRPGESTRTARREGSLAWVGAMQRFMRDHLELEFQLDAIDYDDRPNFVHADMDSETFLKLQEERKEGFLKLFLRAFAAERKRQRAGEGSAAEELTPFHLLAALKAPDRARQLKLLFARQLRNVEGHMEVLEGPNGSVILTERNKVAVGVLREQLDKGHRNIGIFYGAGHFPGIEAILVNEMGFRRVGQTWRTAWDMSDPEAAPPATKPVSAN